MGRYRTSAPECVYRYVPGMMGVGWHSDREEYRPTVTGSGQSFNAENGDSASDRPRDRVIGDRDEALRWIGTPVPALDYATPISLLATSKGKDRVLATLDNLEHGVL